MLVCCKHSDFEFLPGGGAWAPVQVNQSRRSARWFYQQFPQAQYQCKGIANASSYFWTQAVASVTTHAWSSEEYWATSNSPRNRDDASLPQLVHACKPIEFPEEVKSDKGRAGWLEKQLGAERLVAAKLRHETQVIRCYSMSTQLKGRLSDHLQVNAGSNPVGIS